MLLRLMEIFGMRTAEHRPDDRDANARREADLRERLARLEREVDVIQRTQTDEQQHP
jgi:hypothetical protein